jgi:hypothetical protein
MADPPDRGGAQREVDLGLVHDEVVVAEAVPLREAHAVLRWKPRYFRL